MRQNTKNIPIILLSSKQDLIEAGHPFAVAQDDIESFISEENMVKYMAISSKTGINVVESFEQIAELMITKSTNR